MNSTGTILRCVRSLAAAQRGEDESDAELLEGFVSRHDEAAFEVLVRRHGAMVLNVCRRVLGQREDAEDAFQATFVILARKAGSVRKRPALASWLYGAAYRMASSMKRAAARRRLHEGRARAMPSSDPSAQLAWQEVQLLLEQEIHKLPQKYRLVFVLCCLESRPRAQVAQLLGLKEGTVSSRLDQARKRLQARLTRRGISLSGVLAVAGLAAATDSAAAPASVIATTVRAASALQVASEIPAGIISPKVAALVERGVRTLFSARHILMTFLLTVGVAAAGAGLVARQLQPARSDSTQPSDGPRASDDAKSLSAPGNGPIRSDLYGDPLPPGALVRLGTTRLRHGEYACVTFAADGKALLTASAAAIRWWDPNTGAALRPLQTLPWLTEKGPLFAMTPDGRMVVVGDSDFLHLWDVAAGKEFRQIAMPKKEGTVHRHVGWPVLSPDGTAVAVDMGGRETTEVHVWDTASGKLRCRLLAKDPLYDNFGFSRDGRLAAGADCRDGLYIWDARTGSELRRIKAYAGRLTFSPDSRTLLAAERGYPIRIWDVATGKELGQLQQTTRNAVYTLVLSPDGRVLAVGDNGRVILWDVAAQKVLHQLPHGPTDHLAFSPDGKTLASAGAGTVQLWEVASGKRLLPWAVPEREIYRMAVSPDGKLLASISPCASAAYLWETDAGRCRHVLQIPEGWVHSCAFSPDGHLLITGASHGMAYCWDVVTGGQMRRFLVPDPIKSVNKPLVPAVCILAKGSRLAGVSKCIDDRGQPFLMNVWGAVDAKLLNSRPYQMGYDCLFSLDGTIVASQSTQRISIQETATGRQIVTLTGDLQAPMALSPDGRLIAAAQSRGVGVWEVATGKPVETIDCEYARLMAFSPDSRKLATAYRGTIQLWDLTTGKERFRRSAPELAQTTRVSGAVGPSQDGENYMGRLAFLPDGKRLARGMSDGSILIWDMSPGGRPSLPAQELTATELEQLWSALAAEDAGRAYRAAWKLAAAPHQAVPFLSNRLRPALPLPDNRLQSLLADLDSSRFAAREKATKELSQLDGEVEPALQQALERHPSAEARRRLESLLAAPRPTPSQPQLQTLRALAALEQANTIQAGQFLNDLAGGAAAARLTREARASLDRLDQRKNAARISGPAGARWGKGN
jgi:RNA polymerase sigma factor (sigma-70 family)